MKCTLKINLFLLLLVGFFIIPTSFLRAITAEEIKTIGSAMTLMTKAALDVTGTVLDYKVQKINEKRDKQQKENDWLQELEEIEQIKHQKEEDNKYIAHNKKIEQDERNLKLDGDSPFSDYNLPFQLSGVIENGKSIIDDSAPMRIVLPFIYIEGRNDKYQGKKYCTNRRPSNKILAQSNPHFIYDWDIKKHQEQLTLKYIEKESFLEDCPLYNVIRNRLTGVEYLLLDKYVSVAVNDAPDAREEVKTAIIHLDFPELYLKKKDDKNFDPRMDFYIKPLRNDNTKPDLVVDISYPRSGHTDAIVWTNPLIKAIYINGEYHFNVYVTSNRQYRHLKNSLKIMPGVKIEKLNKKKGWLIKKSLYNISMDIQLSEILENEDIESTEINCVVNFLSSDHHRETKTIKNPYNGQIVKFDFKGIMKGSQIECEEYRPKTKFHFETDFFTGLKHPNKVVFNF